MLSVCVVFIPSHQKMPTASTRPAPRSIFSQLCCVLKSIPAVTIAAIIVFIVALIICVHNQLSNLNELEQRANLAREAELLEPRRNSSVLYFVEKQEAGEWHSSLQSLRYMSSNGLVDAIVAFVDPAIEVAIPAELRKHIQVIPIGASGTAQPNDGGNAVGTGTYNILDERFRAYGFALHPALKDTTDILVLSPKAVVTEPVTFDIFRYFTRHRIAYSYVNVVCSQPIADDTLWRKAEKALGLSLRRNVLADADMQRHCSSKGYDYPSDHPWRLPVYDLSVELIHLESYRSAQMAQLMEEWQEGWSAAAVRTLAVHGLYDNSQIHRLQEIGIAVDGVPYGSYKVRVEASRQIMAQMLCAVFMFVCLAILSVVSIVRGKQQQQQIR